MACDSQFRDWTPDSLLKSINRARNRSNVDQSAPCLPFDQFRQLDEALVTAVNGLPACRMLSHSFLIYPTCIVAIS